MASVKALLVQEVRTIAPKLTVKDVEDLLTLNHEQLVKVLTDYKRSRRLNKATVTALVKFLNGLAPFVDLVLGIATVW